MIRGIYKSNSSLSKLFVLIGLLLTGFGVSIILGLTGVQFIFGIDVFSDPSSLSDYTNPENIGALKFVQLFNSIGIFVFPPLMFALMVSNDYLDYLSLKTRPTWMFLLVTACIMFASLPLINYLVELNEQMQLPEFLAGIENWMREKENNAAKITKSFLEMDGIPSYLLNLLVIGIIPAVGEELLFRGLIQKKLSQYLKNYHAGIWIAAFLFSAMHMQFYGFIPRFILGGMFGYLFVWSGSLWIPILAHLINNAGAVTMQYILGSKYTAEHVDTLGTQEGHFMFVLSSVLLLSALLYLAWKMNVTDTGNSG